MSLPRALTVLESVNAKLKEFLERGDGSTRVYCFDSSLISPFWLNATSGLVFPYVSQTELEGVESQIELYTELQKRQACESDTVQLQWDHRRLVTKSVGNFTIPRSRLPEIRMNARVFHRADTLRHSQLLYNQQTYQAKRTTQETEADMVNLQMDIATLEHQISKLERRLTLMVDARRRGNPQYRIPPVILSPVSSVAGGRVPLNQRRRGPRAPPPADREEVRTDMVDTFWADVPNDAGAGTIEVPHSSHADDAVGTFWSEVPNESGVPAQPASVSEEENAPHEGQEEVISESVETHEHSAQAGEALETFWSVVPCDVGKGSGAKDPLHHAEEQVIGTRPPVAEPEAPSAEPEAPAVEPEAPAAEPEAPSAEPEAPSAEPEALAAEPEAPAAEPEAPAAEPEAPAAEPEAPSAEPEAPSAEPEAPAVEPEAPSAEPEAPAAEPEAPAAEPEAPAAGLKEDIHGVIGDVAKAVCDDVVVQPVDFIQTFWCVIPADCGNPELFSVPAKDTSACEPPAEN